MAGKTEQWDLVANLFINPKNLDALEKEFSGSLTKATKKWLDKEVRGPVASALASGLKRGIREGLSGSEINKFVSSHVGEMQEQIEKVLRKSMIAQRAGHEAHAEKLQAKAMELTRKLQAQVSDWKREEDLFERAHQSMQANQIKTAEQVADTWKRGADTAASAMASALRGDVGGLSSSLLSQIGGGGRKMGKAGEGLIGGAQDKVSKGLMSEKAGAAQASKGAGMMKMGGKISMVVSLLEGIVKVFQAFLALDDQMVEMNRTMLDGFGIADMGLTRTAYHQGEIKKRVDELRDATTGMNEQFEKFGLTWKQQQQILGTLNAQGLSYDRIAKGAKNSADRIAEYGQTMNRIGGYAAVLGTSVEEMTGKFAEFSFQTGVNDKQIAEAFSSVTREADSAGFATKRFYQAVSEAASQMSLWGMRIAEVSDLMGTMGVLIGQKFGQDLAASVGDTFSKQSAQQNLTDMLLLGPDVMQDEMTREYKVRMSALESQFGDTVKGMTAMVAGAASETELGKAIETMDTGDLDDEQRRSLRDTMMQAYRARAASEGAGPAMVEQVMSESGPGRQLRMKLRTSQALKQFGGDYGAANRAMRAGGDEGIAGKIAMDNLKKLDPETAEKAERAVTRGNDILAVISDGIQSGLVTDTESLHALNADYKRMGLFLDENNNLMRGNMKINEKGDAVLNKQNAVSTKESLDLFETLIDDQEENAKAVESDLDVAKDIRANTKKISEAIDQTVVGVLNDVYGELSFIGRMIHDLLGHFVNTKRSSKEVGKKTGKGVADVRSKKQKLADAVASGDQDAINKAQKELDKAEQDFTDLDVGGVGMESLTSGSLVSETMSEAGMTDDMVGGKRGASALGQQVGSLVDVDTETSLLDLGGVIPALQGIKSGGEQLGRMAVNAAGFYDAANDPRVTDVMNNLDRMTPEAIAAMGGPDGVRKIAEKAAAAVNKAGEWGDAGDLMMAQQMAKYTPGDFTGDAQVQGKMSDEIGMGDKFDLWFSENLAGLEGPGSFLNANDMFVPSKGRPVLLNSEDEVMAMKGNGPLAEALKGGGWVGDVNVWGGRPSDVTNAVLEALRRAGIG